MKSMHNDQTQTTDQISAKENILSNPRTNFNFGKLFVECKEQLFMRKDNQGARERSEGKYRRSLKERPVLPIH